MIGEHQLTDKSDPNKHRFTFVACIDAYGHQGSLLQMRSCLVFFFFDFPSVPMPAIMRELNEQPCLKCRMCVGLQAAGMFSFH